MIKLAKLMCNQEDIVKYEKVWNYVHQLSGPASILPWPDTKAIGAYCMIIELMRQVEEIEQLLN